MTRLKIALIGIAFYIFLIYGLWRALHYFAVFVLWFVRYYNI
jgi:hypothetical protein